MLNPNLKFIDPESRIVNEDQNKEKKSGSGSGSYEQ
jgi:hypothetical protein